MIYAGDVFEHEKGPEGSPGYFCAGHRNGLANIFIKDVPTEGVNICGNLGESPVANLSITQSPKLYVHKKCGVMIEILQFEKPTFPEADTDPVARLDSADGIDVCDEAVIRRVSQIGTLTGLIRIESGTEIPHVVA